MQRTTPTSRMFTRLIAPITAGAIFMAACGGSGSSAPSSSISVTPRIVITSVKGDTTSQLLAAIYARVLDDAGFRVSRKDPVDMDRAAYYAAIQAGEFQLIPDFTGDLLEFVYSQPGAGTAPTTLVPNAPASTEAPITIPTTTTISTDTTLTGDTGVSTTSTAATTTAPATTVLESTTTTAAPVIGNGRSVTEQLVAIRAALPASLAVNDASIAEAKQVVACTPAAMKANSNSQLITLTNLASIAPNIRLGGSGAFMADQESGLGALQNYYGGEFKDTVTVEDADLADAIDNDLADCFALDSMNSVIATKQLTIMVDDKVMVPSNAAMALLASSIATSDLVAALDTLNSALTTARLNQMLNEVTTNGTDPTVVANAFMDTL